MVANYKFVRAAKANIAYWQERTEKKLSESQIFQLNRDHANILRTVEFGIALPETQIAAIELTLQIFSLIEYCGHWRTWVPLIEEMLKSTEQNPPLHLKLLNRQGQIMRWNRQLAKAIVIHTEAEAIGKKLQDKLATAEIQFHLSEDYRLDRQYDKAETYGLLALGALDTEQDNNNLLASLLNTLGIIAWERGQLDVAESRLSQAVFLWRKTNHYTELARTINNLAITLQAKKKFNLALDYYHEAAEWLQDTASERDKSRIFLSLGSLYVQLGELAKAETVFRNADSIASRQSGDSYLCAVQAHNLGDVLLRQSRFAEAEHVLRRALVFGEQTGDNLLIANTMGNLAETLAAQNQKDEAILLYNKSLLLLAEYKDSALAQRLSHEFKEKRKHCG